METLVFQIFGVLAFVVVGGIVYAILYGYYQNHVYRKYIESPLDWLAIMSSERWDSSASLFQMMNTKIGYNLFEIEINSKLKQLNAPVWSNPHCRMAIFELFVLKKDGFIEGCDKYYRKDNHEFADLGDTPFLIHDDEGSPVVFDHSKWKVYYLVPEYRKTKKGGGIRRRILSRKPEVVIPDRELGIARY